MSSSWVDVWSLSIKGRREMTDQVHWSSQPHRVCSFFWYSDHNKWLIWSWYQKKDHTLCSWLNQWAWSALSLLSLIDRDRTSGHEDVINWFFSYLLTTRLLVLEPRTSMLVHSNSVSHIPQKFSSSFVFGRN